MSSWLALPEPAVLPDVWMAVYLEGDFDSVCRERPPGAPMGCCRAPNHPGRHVAIGGQGRVFAAWPGEHEPTLADLDPAVVAVVHDEEDRIHAELNRADWPGLTLAVTVLVLLMVSLPTSGLICVLMVLAAYAVLAVALKRAWDQYWARAAHKRTCTRRPDRSVKR